MMPLLYDQINDIYSLIDRMVKTSAKVILLIFLATYTSVVITQQTPKKLPITLGKSVTQMQNASTYTYFSSTFNTTKKLLAVTVNPQDDVLLSEFLSLNDSVKNQAYTQYPNSTNYTHKCSHIDLNTCIFDLSDASGQLLNRGVTLYLSVYAAKSSRYTLTLQLVDERVLDPTGSIQLDFAKSQSAVLKIANQFSNSSIKPSIMFTYKNVGGFFDAIAEYDAVPHSSLSQGVTFQTIPYGSLRKVIDLQRVSNASWIYVLVSSEKGSTINVMLRQDPVELTLNSTISEISSQNSSYTVQISNSTSNLTQLGTIYINFGAFSGYGSIHIDYCEDLDWDIQNLNGSTFQIVLSPFLRYMCQQQYQQILTISSIDPINFGYDISLNERYTDFPLLINEKVIAYAINNSQKTYPLQLPPEIQSYYIDYLQFSYQNSTELQKQTQLLVFQVKQCQIKNKNKTCINVGRGLNLQGQINFTSRLGYTYEVQVSDTPGTQPVIYYELSLGYSQVNNSNLIENKQYLQEIALREYKFYWINLTLWKAKHGIINYAQINITIQTLNGNVDLLSSFTIPNPTIDAYIQNSSQIRLLFTDSISQMIDSSVEIIYLSVYGQTASLFNLEYTLESKINTPLRYSKIEDDVINQITLNNSRPYELFSYQSHIKPYTITVDGNPKCIQYGYSLPLSETCFKKLPELLYEKIVYLNISNGKPSPTNFNFNITASSGSNNITAKNSILLSCSSACFSIINVALQLDSRVIIKGDGEIRSLQNSTNKNMKETLALSCPKYPCSSKINASLPFGGAMNVYLMESSITYMNGSLIPFKIKELPKNVIIPITSATDFSDMMLRSDGMSMNLVYHILYLDTNNHNILNVNFTELAQNTEAYYQSMPLRNSLILSIEDFNLGKPNCSKASIQCIAALTFSADFSMPYSYRFASNGQALLSFNQSSSIKLSINEPILLNSSMQMYHFELENSSVNTDSYRVTVEPLSNCRPTIVYDQTEVEHQFNYGSVSLFKPDFPIYFQIVSQESCLYYVSLTSSTFRSIISDKHYTFKTENGDVIIILTLLDRQISSFLLQVESEDQQNIDHILVNQLDNTNSQIVIPTISSNSFMSANSSKLQVSSQFLHRAYIIRVLSKSASVRLIAQQAERIIISPNVQSRYEISPLDSQMFHLYSKKAITLKVGNFTGIINISIHQNGTTSQTIINNVTVNGSKIFEINQDSNDSYITTYEVTVFSTKQVKQRIALSFNEDSKYLRSLYERIVVYDAFSETSQPNCYNYRAPLEVGREKIILDFVLDYNKYTNCSCIDLLYNVSMKGMPAQKAFQDLSTNLTKLQSSVHAYRLQAKFLADQEYTFCFSTPNQSAINKQYYILLNSPVLDHLIPGKETIKYSPNQLDNYQIVQQFINENVMVELTICNPDDSNDKTLVGSTSELVDFAELEELHANSDSIYARISADLGYYFLGVVSKSTSTAPYSLKYSTIGNDTRLLSSTWSLESSNIDNIYINKDGKMVITLPKLLNSDKKDSQANISLTYTVYIINMSDPNAATSTNSTSFAILTRCPNYHSSKTAPPFAKQEVHSLMLNKSVNFNFANLKELQNSQGQVELKFNSSEIPQKFNISGRVDIKVNSQAFSYYYANRYMELPESSDKKHEGSGVGEYIVAAVIALLILLIAGGIYAFLKYRRWKNRQKVDFELANFGENSVVVEKNQGLITAPKAESTKGYYEMNEQIGEK